LKGAIGRKQDRDFHKVTVTVDKELWKLFQREQKRLGASASRTMDTILWRHFGKPRLSFEDPAE
jgi:hypothetical protein